MKIDLTQQGRGPLLCRTGAIAALALFLGAVTLEARTVGIYKGDKRIGDLSGTLETMTNAGWRVEFFDRAAMAKEEGLARYDVLFFSGGFNRYFWTGQGSCSPARRALVRYVAKGGGAVFCGTRGGFVRNATRPAFPQVGVVSCRASSGWIAPAGDSAMARAFDGRMQVFSSGDHLKVDVGPRGRSFCGVDGISCGAYGEVGNGRVIVLGAHFSYRPEEAAAGPLSKILLACLEWAGGGKRGDAVEAGRLADEAETELCRRERTYDVALEGRGPDTAAGSIPQARDYVTAEPEALAYKLDYQIPFLSGKEAESARKLSSELKTAAEAVRGESMRLKKKAEDEIARMDLKGLNAFRPGDYGYGPLVTNLSRLVSARIVDDARSLTQKNGRAIEAERLVRVRRELAEDAKRVPELIDELGSAARADVRYEAATELGRIVDRPTKPVVDALVRALGDKDARVRSQAAVSLGWMQAKEAVQALAGQVEGADRRLARRAVQALGQIGDDRAVPALLKAVEGRGGGDSDLFSLAMISLGQLKAADAVPALRKVARAALKDDCDGLRSDLCECAILALGYIGDKSAVADLDALIEKRKGDGPRSVRRMRNGAKRYSNPYSIGVHANTKSSFGFEWTSQMAKDLIACGGRKEKGVAQNVLLRAKDRFYRITGHCNALAGRVHDGLAAFQGRRRELLAAHLWEAGCTGVHNAWGSPGIDPEDYCRLVRELADFDLCFIDVISGYGGAEKPETEVRLEAFKDNTAYCGFWAEETWPEIGRSQDEFRATVESRYGKDWRGRGLLTEAELACYDRLVSNPNYIAFANLCHPDGKEEEKGPNDSFLPPWHAGLRTLFIESDGDNLVDIWTESQDYLRARRMGCAQTFVVSTADQGRFFGDNRAFNALDSMGVETYQSFGRSTGYWMQRYRDGNARSSMSELYNWYCPSVEHARRGFWQNAVHGKCFYNFALMEIFKHPSCQYLWRWEEGRWDAFREVFRRVRANREYYRIKPTAAKAAVLYSERASAITRNNAYEPCAVPQRADQNAMAIWVSLGQSHIQADVVYVDYVSVEKLRKYGVLVLSDAKYLTDGEVRALREWVRGGGVLVAEGGASLFDGMTAKRRDNYALADVFGVNYTRTDYLSDADSDTFCRRRGDARAQFKFVPGLDGAECRYHSQDSVHRDCKPVKSVRKIAFGDIVAEIDAAVGIDRVRPTTAKPIAAFEDGQPAIFENDFGKGRCYFQCSAYPALGHTTGEWEMMPNRWDFWPGNREMLENLVRRGFSFGGVTQAVEAKGLSGDVELTVDDYGDRHVVHLLDYNVRNKTVKGGRLAVPAGREIRRVFYPDTDSEAVCDGREIALRDFSAYDMLVIEYGEPKE